MPDPATVLVTEFEYHKSPAEFEAAADLGLRCIPAPAGEEELAARVKAEGAAAVIVGTDPYIGALYDALPAGGIVARFGVGHDSVDKAQCAARGIVVANTPGVLNTAVAEHALWLMGAVARHVAQFDKSMKAGAWEPAAGMELAGKTLVVVGLGGIGRLVAKAAGLGFGMRVMGCDIVPKDGVPAMLGVADWGEAARAFGVADYTCDLMAALGQADVVSAHIASVPETAKFFNAEKFAAMKPGAIFINTARGAVVDEAALYDALASNHLCGAGLDVFDAEPYEPLEGKDLRTLSNAVLTPHVSSNTAEANARMARAAIQNVANALAGKLDQVSVVLSTGHP